MTALVTYLGTRIKTKADVEKAYLRQMEHLFDRTRDLEAKLDMTNERRAEELRMMRQDLGQRIEDLRSEISEVSVMDLKVKAKKPKK